MKKYKLKKGVKKIILYIILLVTIILITDILYKENQKAIEQCTQKGFSVNYCIDKLN